MARYRIKNIEDDVMSVTFDNRYDIAFKGDEAHPNRILFLQCLQNGLLDALAEYGYVTGACVSLDDSRPDLASVVKEGQQLAFRFFAAETEDDLYPANQLDSLRRYFKEFISIAAPTYDEGFPLYRIVLDGRSAKVSHAEEVRSIDSVLDDLNSCSPAEIYSSLCLNARVQERFFYDEGKKFGFEPLHTYKNVADKLDILCFQLATLLSEDSDTQETGRLLLDLVNSDLSRRWKRYKWRLPFSCALRRKTA